MFERASLVELSQLAEVLEPPCHLGPYQLTGALARSNTAILFTATGGPLGNREGVLKLTSSHHAPRLQAELERLVRCADAGVTGVVRPELRQLDWIPVPGLLDTHVAIMVMPFLSGGDLVAARRAGVHQDRSVLEVGLVLASTLRHLLELPEPLVHGNLSARSVLLPRPAADISELTLVGLGSACELLSRPREEAARAAAEDVAAFGRLLQDCSGGAEPDRAIVSLIANCGQRKYRSVADPKLWRDLHRAERAERSTGRRPWLARLWSRSA